MVLAGLRLEQILSMREWAPPIVVVAASTKASDSLPAVFCPVSLEARSKGPFDFAVRCGSHIIEEEVPAGLELLLLRQDWHGFRLGCCIIVVSVEEGKMKRYASVLFRQDNR